MNCKDSTLDSIYDTFDKLFRQESFFIANTILFYVAETACKNNLDICIGYLTASFPAKSKLSAREYLYNACLRICKEIGEEELLKGLE